MSRYSEHEYEKLIANNPDLAPNNIVRYMTTPEGDRIDVTPTHGVNDYPSGKRKNKYNNRKVECDGHLFDSIKERNRYLELKRMQEAGEIKRLTLQPFYCLLPAFVDNRGKKQRGIGYQADFCYTRADGVEVIEDVKSVATATNAVFRLKKKMLLHQIKERDDLVFETV